MGHLLKAIATGFVIERVGCVVRMDWRDGRASDVAD